RASRSRRRGRLPGPRALSWGAASGRMLAVMSPEPVERPDPDHLLRRLQEKDQLEKRAKLKLFFGAPPGGGKTTATPVARPGARRGEELGHAGRSAGAQALRS